MSRRKGPARTIPSGAGFRKHGSVFRWSRPVTLIQWLHKSASLPVSRGENSEGRQRCSWRKPAARRSDIWSFGAVLAEMLTGKRQFDGESISHTLASVLKEEPVWEEFPAYLPPRILQLLKRCLRKEPKARLQSIGDARIVMEEYLADPEEFEAAGAPATHSQAPPWRGLLPWAMAMDTSAHTPGPANPRRHPSKSSLRC